MSSCQELGFCYWEALKRQPCSLLSLLRNFSCFSSQLASRTITLVCISKWPAASRPAWQHHAICLFCLALAWGSGLWPCGGDAGLTELTLWSNEIGEDAKKALQEAAEARPGLRLNL